MQARRISSGCIASPASPPRTPPVVVVVAVVVVVIVVVVVVPLTDLLSLCGRGMVIVIQIIIMI